MASQEKVNLNSNCSDLYSLIHALEYENQQYVKMIEKENQRIQYLESQVEEKLDAVTELQTSITNLELETKSNHKQLVHNKNTIESQKKTKVVLQAHTDALVKQLDSLRIETNEQQHEFEASLQHYERIWRDYEAQYKSLPLYKTLLEAEAKLAESECEKSKVQQQKKELQSRIQTAQDELDMRDWRRFCVKIKIRAKKKLCTENKKTELLDAEREIENLQSKLKEICEKNNSFSNNTPLETSQGMESAEMMADTCLDKVTSQEGIAGQDTTEAGGDVGIESVTVKQKKNVIGERNNQSEPEPRNSPNTLAQDRTSVQASGLGQDIMQDQSVSVTKEFRFPSRVPLSDTSTRDPSTLSAGPQLPTTPIPQLSTAFAVPKICHGQAPRTSARPPQSSIKPRQMPIPLITVPKLSASKSVSSSKVPTVRSALSSILSGTKPSTERFQKPVPVMVKNPMPTTPLIAPPPSPVLSSFTPDQQPKLNQTRFGVSKTTPLSVSVPVLSTPAIPMSSVSVREKIQSHVPKQSVLAQPSNMPVSTSVRQLPQVSRPPCTEPAIACKVNTVSKPPLATPVITSSGAGDAPLLHNTGEKSSSLKTNDGGDSIHVVQAAKPDEDMESDAENRGSVSSTPDGILLISSQPCSGEQFSNAFSPFDMQKHMERLKEINQADDDFNPFQRQPSEETTADKINQNETTSTNSVFFMDFTSTEHTSQPTGPLFSKPGVSSTAESNIKPTSPSRQERGGSFFSFEPMDTSETPGGNSLLSMFGNSDREAGSEISFFKMNSNHGVNTRESGFTFSFGDRGGEESMSGSIFSLF